MYNTTLSRLLPILGQTNYSSDLFDKYEKSVGDLFAFSSSQFSSRIKLNETDSQWELSLELPGYATKDIDVKIEDSILTVCAKNEKFGETCKTLDLWDDIETEKISGRMENGILTVSLPKKEKKVQKIKVD